MDLLYLALTAGLFALTLAALEGVERL